jgi:hypothetical protein
MSGGKLDKESLINKESLIKARNERIARSDIHRIDTGRVRTDVAGLLADRKSWDRSSEDRAAFMGRVQGKYPYLQERVPLLFDVAVDSEPEKTRSMLELLLTNIELARMRGDSAEKCNTQVEKDLLTVFPLRKKK